MPWLEQLELPYVDTDTSRRAAVSMIEAASNLRRQVYRFVRDRRSFGATDDEIERALGLRHQTASARRRELVLAGVIWDSGVQRTTSSGRKATVWVGH